MKLLAIETSCDETAAAVVSGPPPQILSNVVASQIDLHQKYGGVFPELASRAHTEKIIPVIKEALSRSGETLTDVDALAVTIGPGLVGSLLIGINAAKSMSFTTGKPLIPVNHLEGHLYANFIAHPQASFPVLALTVAGGHTQLVFMEKHLEYRVLGKTRDDAAGEAFDKVAKLLGLGYPGGPAIEQEAAGGDPNAWRFPRGLAGEGLDFSFSGLKTAVLYQMQKMDETEIERGKADLAASFQEAVVEVLVAKLMRAAHQFRPRSIFLSGGVAANKKLRERLAQKVQKEVPGTLLAVPDFKYCTDNAAMIGSAALYRGDAGRFAPWESVGALADASF